MANQVDLDHKYFISLALKNEIAWSALKFIIEGLTSTLEKSKEVNRPSLHQTNKSKNGKITDFGETWVG